MFISGFILSIAYYPGILSPDVASIYNCAKNFGDINLRSDAHSFLYVILEAILFRITDNYYVLTFLMVFLFSVIWGKLIQFLSEQGGSTKSLISLTFIWISFPRNMWMMIATWKDVPFTICLALLMLLMTKWIFTPKAFELKKSNYVMLTAALFGIATFRSTGQVVVIGIVVLYLILFMKHKVDKKLFMSVLCAIVALIIFKGPVFKVMQVAPTPGGVGLHRCHFWTGCGNAHIKEMNYRRKLLQL